MKHNHKAPPRKRVEYKTPDRECAHADKGCCDTCLDPMQPRVSKGFTLETVAHS
jgi:hypothetical protein